MQVGQKKRLRIKRMTAKRRMNKLGGGGERQSIPSGCWTQARCQNPGLVLGEPLATARTALLVSSAKNGVKNTGMSREVGDQVRWLISWFRASFV